MNYPISNTQALNQNAPTKEQTKEIFEQMANYFNQMGISKDALDETFTNIHSQKSNYDSAGLKFGQDLAEYDAHDVSRSNNTSIGFFYNRNKVAGFLTKGLMGSQNLQEFYNFISYTQNRFEEKTGSKESSPILEELIGSAKKGIASSNAPENFKTQLNNLLESNPQNAIFNPHIFTAARDEVMKRAGLISEVNGQSAQEDSFMGRMGQFGVAGAVTTGAAASLIGKPIRALTDFRAGNSITWGADPSKAIQGKTAFSRYMNTTGGLTYGAPWSGMGLNRIPLANQYGWKAPTERHFRNFVKKLAKTSSEDGVFKTLELPNGIKKTFANKKAFNEYLKSGFKADYGKYLQHHAKSFIAGQKTKLYDDAAKAGATGIKKLAPTMTIIGKHLKTFAKYLPKRIGWAVAGLAAIGFGSTQLRKNPNTQETVSNVAEGTVNTAKSIGNGAMNMFGDWFVPDVGVLYGDPWKDENKTHNILKGAYA